MIKFGKIDGNSPPVRQCHRNHTSEEEGIDWFVNIVHLFTSCHIMVYIV